MLALKDWLPDFKGALNGFYDERIKDTLEQKSNEYKELLQENFAFGKKTQQALIAIAMATFLLLVIAYFWKEGANFPSPKYITVGILVSNLLLYVYDLTKKEILTK